MSGRNKKIKKKLKEKLVFELSTKEILIGSITGIGCMGITSVLFYNSLWFVILMIPYLYLHLKGIEKRKLEKENLSINSQFKDGMLSLSASLGVGYSVENAFKETLTELENLYGEEAILVGEFKEIVRKISLNENVEDALEVMADKINLEDALYFAEVFRFAKRSGGNLIEIMKGTAKNIGDKIEVKEDINVVISGKKMEQKVMNLMPFGIIAYLRFGAYEFVAPLYGNLFGIAVMTICLGVYLGAKMLADKIINIVV